ncbi:hypothetical protein [Anaerotignum sp. MB30-C6]|nr:hypothetical protein [Anaerotignum sp. MB30-C6]WMI81424.1 hypothetical protein RBQ60_01440 [Anaerotignum sp. MB30-C6]
MDNQKTKAYWQKFVQTGQIEDYLRYKSGMGDKPNPRRRISDSSKNKEFY